jgi:hypothetical protein
MVDGGAAYVSRRVRLTRTATWKPISARPAPAQRRPVRMVRLFVLVLADLPVDVVVVLEQQERAGEAKRTERAPCNR